MRVGNTVLVDTNVIIEGYIQSCWPALTGAYRVETVETCVLEAMTGRYDWYQTKPTDGDLRASLAAIHKPTAREIAQVMLKGGAVLDKGERDLWAHALGRNDTWILCGPDRASMRFGYEQKQRDRLVSLGSLLKEINFRPRQGLRAHFEEPWLDEMMRKLVLDML